MTKWRAGCTERCLSGSGGGWRTSSTKCSWPTPCLTLPQIDRPATTNEIETDEICEAIVAGWANRPALHLTSEHEYRAYYRSSTDSVHMPARSRFVDAPHYYSTLFHELIHSTGHESRLNRTFGAGFGDELYSKEELIAEMGAAFLCAIAEIANEHTDRNTTAYIQNWISQLQEDDRLIVQAAANAQRAVDSILDFTFESEGETEEREEEAATSGFPAPPGIDSGSVVRRRTNRIHRGSGGTLPQPSTMCTPMLGRGAFPSPAPLPAGKAS